MNVQPPVPFSKSSVTEVTLDAMMGTSQVMVQLDFNDVTDREIEQVQFKINRRPRKKLQFEAPKSVFYRNI